MFKPVLCRGDFAQGKTGVKNLFVDKRWGQIARRRKCGMQCAKTCEALRATNANETEKRAPGERATSVFTSKSACVLLGSLGTNLRSLGGRAKNVSSWNTEIDKEKKHTQKIARRQWLTGESPTFQHNEGIQVKTIKEKQIIICLWLHFGKGDWKKTANNKAS